MEITIVRSGGIAGFDEQLGPVETSRLDDLGKLIEIQVEEAAFFELPSDLPVGDEVVDVYSYVMTVDDGSRRNAVRYSGFSEGPARWPLFLIQRLLVESGELFKRMATATATFDDGEFTWVAWRNRLPGSRDADLYVVGSCTFGSSSVELSLEPGNVGIVPEPDSIALQLTISRPSIGDDRISEEIAIWKGDVGPDVKLVRIQGDAEAGFPVWDVL